MLGQPFRPMVIRTFTVALRAWHPYLVQTSMHVVTHRARDSILGVGQRDRFGVWIQCTFGGVTGQTLIGHCSVLTGIVHQQRVQRIGVTA
jgi:hypothetical protein